MLGQSTLVLHGLFLNNGSKTAHLPPIQFKVVIIINKMKKNESGRKQVFSLCYWAVSALSTTGKESTLEMFWKKGYPMISPLNASQQKHRTEIKKLLYHSILWNFRYNGQNTEEKGKDRLSQHSRKTTLSREMVPRQAWIFRRKAPY